MPEKFENQRMRNPRRIVIYSPYWRTLGGGERYMLYLAYALSKIPRTEVSIASEHPDVRKEYLESIFNLDLSSVNYISIAKSAFHLKKLSENADIFVALSNFRPIRVRSKDLIQVFQVPYAPITMQTVIHKLLTGSLKEGAKDLLRRKLINHAKRQASLTISNSKFTHDVLLENFGLESKVLYPPIDDHLLLNVKKEKIILSVGRFFRGLYNDKRYDILCAAFRQLAPLLPDWEYHIVGSAADEKNTNSYIESIKKENMGFPIFLHLNESRGNLLQLYNRATIFWHGAGFGVDEKKFPDRTEHFGMSVAEAMTARCVPIVVNRGGLKEVVTEGINGFLWSEISELIDRTIYVAKLNTEQLISLQDNARKVLNRFSIDTFVSTVRELFQPLIEKTER